jgi:hypothetical protein
MADARQTLTDQELEDQLRELGRHVALPSANQLAQRVRVALLAEGAGAEPRVVRREAWWPRHGRRSVIVLAACLALIALVIAVTPGARATFTRLLSIRGVEITHVPPGRTVVPVVGGTLNLGPRTTLAAAQTHVRFPISLPRYQTITRPDEIYLGGPLPGQVSLLYRARPGFPRAAGTGVGLLITEFRAGLESVFLKKLVGMGVTVEDVRFPGARGVWLSGSPHFFGYATGGNVIVEPLRLAGNTLLWERGPVTYRLEGSVSKETAINIAESMR